MIFRHVSMAILILTVTLFLAFPVIGDEPMVYYIGANSTAAGCVTGLNNQGVQSYVKFGSVAPHVNRLRIVNKANGNIMFDGKPDAGQTVYVPAGAYTITAWSAYGTDDPCAVSVTFQSAPEPPPAAASTPTASPSQDTVDSYPSDQYNPGGYYPGYYPYPGGYDPAHRPNPRPTCQLVWCTYCGKYHPPGKCVFTMKTKSVLDPYNPYWRGNK